LLFYRNARKIYKNIQLGKQQDRSDRKGERLKNMLLVAFGQKKMFKRPIAALLHLGVYLGFVIINIEMLEIVIDGLFGTHRVFSFLGPLYGALIASFEVLAAIVLVGCVVFLIRRNVLYIKRLRQKELAGWPKSDANIILVSEILLMTAFLFMNAADFKLQTMGFANYHSAGAFPVSSMLVSLLPQGAEALVFIERFC